MIRDVNRAANAGAFSLRPLSGGNLIGSNGMSTLIAFPNPWTAWVMIPTEGDAVHIWHTGNGGQHWSMTTISHAALSGGVGILQVAAVGNHDAWMVATSGALAGHVAFQVWRTQNHVPWRQVYQGEVSGTSGLTFITGTQGILTGGNNVYEGHDSASLLVTRDRGTIWTPPQTSLPVLPGNWATTVLAPTTIPHTDTVLVPVLLQKPFPSKTAPLKTWWQLDQSVNGGKTWHALPTPDPVLKQPPQTILQSWITPLNGWVVLGPHLFRTADGGIRWKVSDLPAGDVINLSRVSTTTGFMLVHQGSQTVIYCTHNGGITWFTMSS